MQNRGKVLGPAVLIFQIVSMLPDIDLEQRLMSGRVGLSWLALASMASFPLLSAVSQAQPLPNTPVAAVRNAVSNSS